MEYKLLIDIIKEIIIYLIFLKEIYDINFNYFNKYQMKLSLIFLILAKMRIGSCSPLTSQKQFSRAHLMKGLYILSSMSLLPTVNSSLSLTFQHCSLFISISSLLGSIYCANHRLSSVYSWPGKSSVSCGRLISFCSEQNSQSGVHSADKRPQPPMNSVSPENRKGVFVDCAVTCVTTQHMCDGVWPGVFNPHTHKSPISIVCRSLMMTLA